MRGKAGLWTALGVWCWALGATGYLASAAQAADTIYWSSSGNAIRAGTLSGTGTPSSLFTGENAPRGVAIDPVTGRLYWTTGGGGSGNIRIGSLDGTGSASSLYVAENGPEGIVVDHTAGKVYWADFGGTIRVASLNGGGPPLTLFSAELAPVGIAIDPAAGKVYWTDSGSGLIRVGNIDGSGSAATLFSGESNPRGVAIDPVAGKIYWAKDAPAGAVRVANLNGSGSASDLFSGESNPEGVAIDPSAGTIYWADRGSGLIRVGNLSGTGSPASLFTGENLPTYPTLLHSPAGAGSPQITGGSSVGSTLSCSQGSWAPDLLGASLYRAPQSFAYSWTLNGAPIASATSNTLPATSAGQYTCQVTAANLAGATSQTSAVQPVLGPTTITKAKIKSSKHTARFSFKAAGAITFQCELIKKKKGKKKAKTHFSNCTSPKTYKQLKKGKYTFEVRAVSGGITGTPATKSFKIA